MILYDIGIWFYEKTIHLATLRSRKAQLWCDGRRGLLQRIEQDTLACERVVWIHAASLGEFEQGRPIIERLKALRPEVRVVLTFFSPSGFEIRKNYPAADRIYYLPTDKPDNVRRFLDAVRPEVAIFIKYEFWLNYLAELRRRGIATILVSAIFRRNSIFFRPWGGAWRRALRGYSHLYVQDSASEQLLRTIGVENITVAGDTRFDRVRAIAEQAKQLPIVERFRGDSPLFVAGSTWQRDEELLLDLINRYPTVRFLVAPHEMDERRIAWLMRGVRGGAMRYTEATTESDFSRMQVLILDTIGILSSAYAYARWAYIGGGFGAGIHNTLEAATYGLPIAFGPKYHKFREAKDMVALGVATSVKNKEQLCAWFQQLHSDEAYYDEICAKARHYTHEHCGATAIIVDDVLSRLK